MYRFVLLLFCLLAACSPKHPPLRVEPNRILFQSAELTNPPATDDSIKLVRPVFMGRSLNVRYTDGQVKRVPKNTFWGYADKKGRVYRAYKRNFLYVVSVGDLVKYEVQSTQTVTANGHTHATPVTHTYYSKTLDSKVYASRRKALRDTLVTK